MVKALMMLSVNGNWWDLLQIHCKKNNIFELKNTFSERIDYIINNKNVFKIAQQAIILLMLNNDNIINAYYLEKFGKENTIPFVHALSNNDDITEYLNAPFYTNISTLINNNNNTDTNHQMIVLSANNDNNKCMIYYMNIINGYHYKWMIVYMNL